jgi:signal transduction histidine kinase
MENYTDIIVTATVFTLLIIGLAALIIFTAQRKKDKLQIEMQQLELRKQKEISENTLQSQENERQKISMELHDELGPTFAAIRFDIARIRDLISKPGQEEKMWQIASDADQNLGNALGQFSNLTRLLYPVVLNRLGLNEALSDICAKAGHNSSISFSLGLNNLRVEKKLVATSIYRICQELCTNAVKHSEADQVYINLDQDQQNITFEYRDNGKGYDTTQIHEGLGLNSIKGRVEAIAGNLKVESTANKGVSINIVIPYELAS